ncbi:CMP-sialic acid transporter 3-like protein [Tanacetum coccineum]
MMDMMDISNEIQESLGRSYSVPDDIDEDELLGAAASNTTNTVRLVATPINYETEWEARALLLIGISINQMRSLLEGSTAMGPPVAMAAYIFTFIFVTIPSMVSMSNEYALKSQFDTSIYMYTDFLSWATICRCLKGQEKEGFEDSML